MQIGTILFKLWRARRLVAGVAVVAVLAGVALAFRVPRLQSRQYVAGTASVRILVDTPSSQVIAVNPTGMETLPARADLLASLMVAGQVKSTIARLAGVRPGQIDGIAEASTDQPPGPAPAPRGYVLTTNVATDSAGNPLPIVEVTTQAPDVAGAAKLANAAVAGLQDYLASRATIQGVPAGSRLEVSGIGPAQAIAVVHGPGPLLAIGLGVFVFLIGCGAILVVPAMLGDWRAASEAEMLGDHHHEDAPALPRRERLPRLLRRPGAVRAPRDADDRTLPPVAGESAPPQRLTGSRG